MVQEDPEADIREDRAVGVTLHLCRLGGPACRPRNSSTDSQRCGANRDDSREDGCDDREPASPRRSVSCRRCSATGGERKPPRARRQALHSMPRRAPLRAAPLSTGQKAPAALRGSLARECERDQSDRESGAGQCREVVDADERRLALPWTPAFESSTRPRNWSSPNSLRPCDERRTPRGTARDLSVS